MNENGALLNDIYRLSQAAEYTIRRIHRYVRDDTLVKHFAVMREAYQSLNLQALQMLNRYGIKERDIKGVRRYCLRTRVRWKLLRASSPAEIARLLLYQSTDCMVRLLQDLRVCQSAHPDARSIAQKMLHIEELNLAQLKTYI